MKKFVAAFAAMFVASLVVVGACGVAATHAAPARHKPTPRQVQIYQCTVTHGAADGCATIPGVWNHWAGRITPPRWDPCLGLATLFYLVPCGSMSPTVRQWCTLHVDHRYLGRDLCS
jgi:hypothetical protein